MLHISAARIGFLRRPVGPLGLADLRLLVGIGVGICVFAVGGTAERLGVPGTAFFDLDAEYRGAAIFSALLLLGAGGATAAAWGARAAHGTVVPVAGLLLFMAADEFFGLHEAAERSTGLDWQLLYLPVFVLAAAAALVALYRHRSDRAFTAAWVVGGACWGIAQVLEKLQWDGAVQRRGYALMMIPEELLEMLGTAAFLVGALVLLRRPRTR